MTTPEYQPPEDAAAYREQEEVARFSEAMELNPELLRQLNAIPESTTPVPITSVKYGLLSLFADIIDGGDSESGKVQIGGQEYKIRGIKHVHPLGIVGSITRHQEASGVYHQGESASSPEAWIEYPAYAFISPRGRIYQSSVPNALHDAARYRLRNYPYQVELMNAMQQRIDELKGENDRK